jgi:hypothetical protein
MTDDRRTKIILFFAVSMLALAAWTGVLLRFGFTQGMPAWALNFGAVRHAHSHLMYFGWVTPGLMALIWFFLPRYTGRPLPKGVGWQMGITAFAAFLSFPAFWINGYSPTQIGSASLPLGSMAATFNGLSWLIFVWLYVRATQNMGERPLPVRLWDWAIILMVLSSIGAVGLPATIFMGVDNPMLQQLFLHLFLDLFSVGWFTMGLLGALWATLGEDAPLPDGMPVASLAILLTPTFILGMLPSLVTPAMFWVAILANLGAVLLLSRHLWTFFQRRSELPVLVRFGLLFGVVYVAGGILLLWPGLWQWAGGGPLRIFFLHNLLLGWVSSVLLGLILARFGRQAPGLQHPIDALWMGGVSLLVVTLLALGFLAYAPGDAVFWFKTSAWVSVGPATAALLALVELGMNERAQSA